MTAQREQGLIAAAAAQQQLQQQLLLHCRRHPSRSQIGCVESVEELDISEVARSICPCAMMPVNWFLLLCPMNRLLAPADMSLLLLAHLLMLCTADG
jgi:hypothetical protein